MRDVQGGSNIAKITVSGIGLRSHTHVATMMFEKLAEANINVEMISTSELASQCGDRRRKARRGNNRLGTGFRRFAIKPSVGMGW